MLRIQPCISKSRFILELYWSVHTCFLVSLCSSVGISDGDALIPYNYVVFLGLGIDFVCEVMVGLY